MGSMCSKCFGGDEIDVEENAHIRNTAARAANSVNPAERRQAALDAAEKRRIEQQTRGQKGDPEFERLRLRQQKIDKAEEEARKSGGFGGQAPLAWQVN